MKMATLALEEEQASGEEEEVIHYFNPKERPAIKVIDKDKHYYIKALLDDVTSGRDAGSPLKADYRDSTVAMYKNIKTQED